MEAYEYTFRALLMLIGFLIILAGGALAAATKREVTPVLMMGIGVVIVGLATWGFVA